ncbi:hypothetical protein V6N13_117270 [Hibiscus sabdariffa]
MYRGRSIADILSGREILEVEWKLTFSRPLFDRELLVLEELLKDIGNTQIGSTGDRLSWIHDRADISNEGRWWSDPFSCQEFAGVVNQILPSSLEHEAHFYIKGIVANKRAACGGVMFVKKGEIRALCSGPVCGENRFLAGLIAVKMAIEIFKASGWVNIVSLVIFLDCRILLNWIESPMQRPWGLAKEFAALVVLRNDITHIQFHHIERSDNILAARLAHDGLSRLNWFKAWW